MKALRMALFAGLVLGSAAIARADDSPNYLSLQPQNPAPPVREAQREPFAEGSSYWQVTGSYYSAYEFGEDDVDGGLLRVGYAKYVWDNVAIVAELAGYYLDPNQFPEDEVFGAGFNLLARWHFLNFESFSIFADGGAGIAWFDSDFPAGGTQFNFTPQAGLGATWKLSDSMHLIGGARYLHISNASIEGRDNNPGFDGVEYYVGLMFTF